MPFQPGNKLGGRKEKPFRDALVLSLKEAGEDMPELRTIARKLIKAAQQDDAIGLAAAKEVADRLDGKVPQGIVGGDEGDPPLQVYGRIERVLIDPKSAKSES